MFCVPILGRLILLSLPYYSIRPGGKER